MSYIIDKNHVALSASKDVNEICKSLFEDLGFNYFNYSRLFNDFSHTSLTSNPVWAEFFYKHDYKNKFLYSSEIVKLVGNFKFLIWSDFKTHSLIKNLNDYFHTDHGIIIIEVGEGYTDFYSFAAPSSTLNITSFYLNNMNLLQNFIYYFREKAIDLIKTANASKIYLPDQSQDLNFKENKNPFLETHENKSKTQLNIDKFIKNNIVKKYYTREIDFYLTTREMQSLSFYAQGYSTKQIASFLKLSPRTVETYLQSISNKTRSFYKKGLMEYYHKFFSLHNVR